MTTRTQFVVVVDPTSHYIAEHWQFSFFMLLQNFAAMCNYGAQTGGQTTGWSSRWEAPSGNLDSNFDITGQACAAADATSTATASAAASATTDKRLKLIREDSRIKLAAVATADAAAKAPANVAMNAARAEPARAAITATANAVTSAAVASAARPWLPLVSGPMYGFQHLAARGATSLEVQGPPDILADADDQLLKSAPVSKLLSCTSTPVSFEAALTEHAQILRIGSSGADFAPPFCCTIPSTGLPRVLRLCKRTCGREDAQDQIAMPAQEAEAFVRWRESLVPQLGVPWQAAADIIEQQWQRMDGASKLAWWPEATAESTDDASSNLGVQELVVEVAPPSFSTAVVNTPIAADWCSTLVPPTIRRPWHVFEEDLEDKVVDAQSQKAEVDREVSERLAIVQARGARAAFLDMPAALQRTYAEVALMELSVYVCWRDAQTCQAQHSSMCARTELEAAWDLLDDDLKSDWLPDDPRARLSRDETWTVLLSS